MFRGKAVPINALGTVDQFFRILDAQTHHMQGLKPYQANPTLGVLSKMFSLAEIWGLRPGGSNPCRHVKRYKESQRERFLSPEDTERLGEILAEAESEMPSAVAAFRLLLLTGCLRACPKKS